VRIVGEVFDAQGHGTSMITGIRTLAAAGPGLAQPDQYDVGLRPGTSPAAYAQALGTRLGSGYMVILNSRNSVIVTLMLGLIGTLTLLLALVAGLGVLNTIVLHTREKVHDLGVFKAIGMTPRQTIAMVTCWVAGTGLAAGVIAVPAGIALERSARHGLVREPGPAGELPERLPRLGTCRPGPGRGHHRGGRRPAPGRLGRADPHRLRAARRVRRRQRRGRPMISTRPGAKPGPAARA
jgi:hypothetical protein